MVATPLIVEETLRLIYFSYVHSIIPYGLTSGGNSLHSNNIFKIKKLIILIITKSRQRDSCRQLFKKLEIVPFYSQYIFFFFIIDCGEEKEVIYS